MSQQTKEMAIAAAALVVLAAAVFLMRLFLTGQPQTQPSQTAYVGHYGYAFSISTQTAARMQIFGAFTDPEKTSEAVFVFPREMNQDEPFSVSEAKYRQLGILRMEVNPNRNFPEGKDLLGSAKAAIDVTLKEKKEPYTIQDIREPMPGFVVDIATPTNLRQVFLKGQKVHYLITIDPENTVLDEVLSSLVEISPHEQPGK